MRRTWGSVVVRSDTNGAEIVYHGPNSWLTNYAARTQNAGRPGLRTWEEALLAVGLPIGSIFLASAAMLPPIFLVLSVLVGVGAIAGLRYAAKGSTTARFLPRGKAIRALVTSGNNDLIKAAIQPVIGLDSDPRGAANLVAEINEAWEMAEASSATEKQGILAALRETAKNFPTTDDGVSQVRQEVAALRQSLKALDSAQRALDATTSTADLEDPPAPPKSLGLLRAASQTINEDAQVVLEVAEEQRARRLNPPDAG